MNSKLLRHWAKHGIRSVSLAFNVTNHYIWTDIVKKMVCHIVTLTITRSSPLNVPLVKHRFVK